jgi:hypothetical protein
MAAAHTVTVRILTPERRVAYDTAQSAARGA